MLVALYFALSCAQRVYLPGIEQFGRGIDLAFSNPNGAGGADPGLRLNVFQLQSYASNTSFNAQYLIPDGISVRPAPGCSYNSKVTVIHDTQDYQEDVMIRSKTTHKLLFWSHSSTEEFNYVQTRTASSENVIISARAECSAYSAHLNTNTLNGNQLSPSFVLAVQQLPSTWDPLKPFPWIDFVQKFGTHFMSEAKMGGTAQQSSTFSQSNFSALVQQGTNLQDAAALDFLKLFGGDLWVNRSKSYHDYQQFASRRLAASPPLWIPQMPPSSPDVAMSADAWAQQVQLPNGNPGLISYSLQELSDLLTYQFFNASSEPDLAAKAKYLSYFIENVYCNTTAGSSCSAPVVNPKWNSNDLALPAPRAHHCTVVVGQTVYVLGGVQDQTLNAPFVASMFNLHGARQWEHIPSLNPATDADCAVLNEQVYMVGGNINGKPTGSCAVFDTSLRMWIMDQGVLNTPRFGLTTQVVAGRLFAIGGKGTNALATVERYDPLTNTWEIRSNMPTARFGVSSVAYNNQIIVFGGTTDGNNALNSVEIYDTIRDLWSIGTSPIPAACFPRFFHRTVLVSDPISGPVVYMLGGISGGQSLADLSIFDPVRFTWTKTNLAMQAPRAAGGLVVLGEVSDGFQLHWLGGNEASSGTPSDCHWVLQLPPAPQPLSEPFRFERSSDSFLGLANEIGVSLPSLPAFSAVDYLSYGYNILRGNPLTSSSDPGWTSQGAFQVACSSCFKSGRTFLGQYLLPDGVSVEKLETCSYDSKSFVSHSELDLQSVLSAFADGRAHARIPKLFNLRFKASISDTVATVSKGELNVSIVGATATCEAYRVMINDYTPNIILRDDFVQGVANLPLSFDPTNPWPWYDFIESYGTHYPSALTLGGRATQMSTIESESLYYLQTQNVDLDACAKASFLNLFGASKQITGSMSSRSYELLTQYTANNYTYCTPACPSRAGDIALNASIWAQSVQLPLGSPVPIESVLIEITQLFNASLFPAAMQSVVETQRNILTQFLNSTENSSYCYLVGVCNLPSTRPLWMLNFQLQLPINRSHSVVNLVNDTLLVSGGITIGPSPSVGVMTFATQIVSLSNPLGWGTIDPFPGQATALASSLTVGSRVLVFGGEDVSSLPLRDAWAFDISSRWTRLAFLPANLTRSASAVLQVNVYLIGGISSNKQFSTTVYIYDVQKNSWASGSASFPARASAVAAALNTDIYVCGGYSNTGSSLADVIVYHTDSDTWDPLQLSLPYPLFGAAIVQFSDRFIIVGGTRSDLNKQAAPSRDVYMFQPQDLAWQSLPALPLGLTNPGAFISNDTLYVVGGSATNLIAVSSVYTLSLDFLSTPLSTAPVLSSPHFQHLIHAGENVTKMTKKQNIQVVNNIFPLTDFAGHGYNRVRGSPLTSGRDEGWAIQSVLDLTCASCFSKNKTFNGFAVPDVLQVDPLDSCAYSAESFLVRDSLAYQQMLQKEVSFNDDVSVPILVHLEFTASAALQEMTRLALDVRAGVAVSRGRCEMYSMLLDDVVLSDLHFTDNFIAGLLSLPAMVTKESLQPFFEFVEAFGTHLPTHLTLGGETSQVTQFADASLAQLFTLNVDVSGASQDSLLVFFGLDVSAGGLAHLADYLQFSVAFEHNSTSCKPLCPPAGPDINSNTAPWIRQLTVRSGVNGTQPTSVPIGMSLTAITDLMGALLNPLAIRRLSSRPAFLGEMDILLRLKTAQQNLQQFLNTEYCGMVDGCMPPSALPQWQPARALDPPTVVCFAAGAQTSSTLFLVGGSDIKRNPVSNFLNFDLNQQKWTYGPPLSQPRTQAGAVVSGDFLYVLGGVLNGNKPTSSVQSFQLSKSVWSNTTASMQTTRAWPAVAAIGGLLYVAGGFSGANSEASIEVYDPQANSWTWFPAKLAVPRHGAAVLAEANTFFVVGGATGSSSQPVDCVELVNVATKSITVLLPLPSPRAFASAFKFLQSLFVVGGLVQTQFNVLASNDVHVLDLAQNAWFEASNSLFARAGASYFQTSVGGLIFGGENSTASAMDASVQFVL